MSILTALRDVGSVNYNPRANPPNVQNRQRYNNVAPINYNRNNYQNLDRLDINQNRNQNYQYYANQYQANYPNMNRPNLNNNNQRSNAPLQQKNRPMNQSDRNRGEYGPNNAPNRRNQTNTLSANLREANNLNQGN